MTDDNVIPPNSCGAERLRKPRVTVSRDELLALVQRWRSEATGAERQDRSGQAVTVVVAELARIEAMRSCATQLERLLGVTEGQNEV